MVLQTTMSVPVATTSALTSASTSLDPTRARVPPGSHSEVHTHAGTWTSVRTDSTTVTCPQGPPVRTHTAPTFVCVEMDISWMIQDSHVKVYKWAKSLRLCRINIKRYTILYPIPQ